MTTISPKSSLSETGAVSSSDSLSIIIPTRNGAFTLSDLLTMLRQQTVHWDELLVVDTESNDTTRDIALDFGAKISSVKKEDFDHGGTRSWIAGQAKGDILVFFTQDAIPVTPDAIEKLIAPINEDRDISVTYGRQLPNHDAGIAASQLRLFNYPATSSVRCFEDREKLGLKTIFVSNSFAAYRKSSLAAVGYFKNGLIFGEDTCTVGRMLKEGMKIAYVADAKVYHSHNYTWKEDFKRAFDIGVLHSREKWLLETYGRAESIGRGYIRSQIANLVKIGGLTATIDFIARNSLKFFGYKLGRQHKIMPTALILSLSMHRSWWRKGK